MAPAGGSIDGTWKADLASVQIDSKPTEFLLQNGQFECKTCIPAYKVAADGAWHAVKRPYSDSMMVKVVDDRTVKVTSKKGDAMVGENTFTVSADGKTLTVDFTDSSVPNAPPVKGNVTQTRASAAPAGAHAMSGGWKVDKYNNMSVEGLTVTFKTDGDMVHMTTPAGLSYDAKIGGPDVPIKGDTAGTTAMVAKNGDALVETDKRDGEVISVTTFTAGTDGKLHVVTEDKRDGSTVKYDAAKS